MSRSVCPDCGKTLPAEVDGSCPNCLLKLGVKAPRCDEASSGAAGASPDSIRFTEHSGDVIDVYRLLEIIGEGAFGTVWMAEQQEPVRRRVALKIIKLGMDTRAVVARFEAERQALAIMDHPNIARVFDGGSTQSGRPYFVMELVRGVPLTDYCDARQLNPRERIDLFVTVCEAVQHAHQKGIIHRDLKPSNILVTEQDGRAVAKVIDFGIAKATEQRLTDKTLFTHFNQFMGTPAYMSPEQTGLGLDMDTRSDIYSLGVLLYELITGQTPFDTRKLLEAGLEITQKTIREAEPPKPSARLSTLTREELISVAARRREAPHSLNRMIRGEIDWIILKALEKDRSRRYQSANGFAADLRRFLDNEAVGAAPPTFTYRFAKFTRRNRTALATASAFLIVLIGGVVVSTWYAVRATQNLTRAGLNAYASEMNVAQEAIRENNLERALQLLNRQRPKPGEEELRGFEWRYLWQMCQGNETAILTNAPPENFAQCAVAFSPDGRFLVYSGKASVIVLDAKTHQVVKEIRTPAVGLSFAPASDLLVTSGDTVRFWDTTNWSEVRMPSVTNAVAPAIFSPDGRWLVTGVPATNQLQLWNTKTWERVAACEQTPVLGIHDRAAVTFSPDGKLLVTGWLDIAGKAGGVRLWRIPTLENYVNLYPAGVALLSAAFLPNSKFLLTGSWVDQLLVWDLDSEPPKLIRSLREHSAYIPAIAVAPGAKTFATASADQSICLWDASTFKRVARWRGHRREVWALAMSPDGAVVASSSPDGSVRLWRGQPQDTGETWTDAGYIAGFSADGRTVVFGPSENDYRWQLVTGTNRVVIPIPEKPPLKFEFDITPWAVKGNEPLAALGRTEGRIELWNLKTRQLDASWSGGTNWVSAVAFSPDGAKLATGDGAGFVKVWNLATHAELATIRTSGGFVGQLKFSPDGKSLAAGSYFAQETGVWDIESHQRVCSLKVPANQVAFAPDGKSIVTCSVGENEAHIWDFPSAHHKTSLKGHVGGMTELSFSPDGRTLATGAYDGRIKLWNIATSQEVATFPHPGTINALSFSPDGRTLAASFGYSRRSRRNFSEHLPWRKSPQSNETAQQRLVNG